MGKSTGFMEYARKDVPWDAPSRRLENFEEFRGELDREEREKQGARCMDCGIPFCHSDLGCPVNNLIPEWNDLIYQGKWEEAIGRLLQTNNFPEYTGRVCPAPCEHACVLSLNEPAVTIKDNECSLIDWAYQEGLIQPRPPQRRTGKTVAVIGSGPAGLAAADQLNKSGHAVTVFERADRPGGLLMYGIPNMKLDKKIVERRNDLMIREGVVFRTNTTVGRDISIKELQANYHAVLIAAGSTVPRDLPVPGRSLKGVHFAMDFLAASTKSILDSGDPQKTLLSAAGKDVVVIGGGDTGNDCLGTALRQGCRGLYNFELFPKPPAQRDHTMPWPQFAKTYKLDYGHGESQERYGRDPREYSLLTKEFLGDTHLEGIRTVQVRWNQSPGAPPRMEEIPGTLRDWPADLAFLSLGFLGPEKEPFKEEGLRFTERGNLDAPFGGFHTSLPGVFAAGDARRGQSLVVWAIREGRDAAREIHRFLGASPKKN